MGFTYEKEPKWTQVQRNDIQFGLNMKKKLLGLVSFVFCFFLIYAPVLLSLQNMNNNTLWKKRTEHVCNACLFTFFSIIMSNVHQTAESRPNSSKTRQWTSLIKTKQVTSSTKFHYIFNWIRFPPNSLSFQPNSYSFGRNSKIVGTEVNIALKLWGKT